MQPMSNGNLSAMRRSLRLANGDFAVVKEAIRAARGEDSEREPARSELEREIERRVKGSEAA